MAPLAEILRLNGFSTAAFGKYHETAPWEVSVSGREQARQGERHGPEATLLRGDPEAHDQHEPGGHPEPHAG